MPIEVADERVARIVRYFETLTRAALARIGEVYTDDASFKDPFNEVRGLGAIRRVYEHMFDTLDRPAFAITGAVVQGAECMLTWNFVFVRRGGGGEEFVIRGASHLRLAADGRIAMHRDYWDAAEELYEKLPLIGALMRWLKQRLAA